MWIAVDIGNSRVKAGAFSDGRLVWSVQRERERSDDWWSWIFDELLANNHPERIGVASVVPEWTASLNNYVDRNLGKQVFEVSSKVQLPFRLGYQTPHTIGSDRLAAAAAAFRFYRVPDHALIVVDAGTAVNVEVIDAAGTYLGGPIGPGAQVLASTMSSSTSQLPEVPLFMPDNVIGRTTQEALQSGIMFGFIDAVAGLITRTRAEIDDKAVVVLTGGWADLLRDHLTEIDHVDRNLVLDGVVALMEMNQID